MLSVEKKAKKKPTTNYLAVVPAFYQQRKNTHFLRSSMIFFSTVKHAYLQCTIRLYNNFFIYPVTS